MKERLKKINEKIKKSKISPYILIVIIGLILSIPLLWVHIKSGHDGHAHISRIYGLDIAINTSQFPYLISSQFMNNFGYSMYVFYGLLVTYIPYILGIINDSVITGLKLFTSLTIILSGFTMYGLVKEVLKNRKIALIAAILYMIFPYRLETIYVRFAIGEFAALVFIPIVFHGLYNLIYGDKKKHYLIAIGATCLILTHTISTVYTALFCVIAILFNVKTFFVKENIIKCAVNVVVILLLSAICIIPMLEFKSQATYSIFVPELMKTSGSFVSKNIISVVQLFKNTEQLNDLVPVSFKIGIPTFILLLSSFYVYKKINNKQLQDFINIQIFCMFIGCIFIFCSTLWYVMPSFLTSVQYPWRLLGFVMFFASILNAINIYYIIKNIDKKKIKILVGVIIVLLFSITTFNFLKKYDSTTMMTDEIFMQILEKTSYYSTGMVNREYLPINAIIELDYIKDREDRVYILDGEAVVQDEYKQDLEMSFKIHNAKKGDILELPYIFYPGYEIILNIDGKDEEIEVEESIHGMIQIKILDDIDDGSISIKYTGTTLEKVSYIISGITLIIFIMYIIKTNKNNKKKQIEEGKEDENEN